MNLGTSGTAVTHVYSAAGNYSVRVVVRDVNGQESQQVTILNVTGVVSVDLTADDSEVTVNTQTAVFHAVVTGATVLQYRWNFGDGSEQTTTVPNVQHVYTSIGAKIVTVTVTTTDGSTGTAQLSVSVVNPDRRRLVHPAFVPRPVSKPVYSARCWMPDVETPSTSVIRHVHGGSVS